MYTIEYYKTKREKPTIKKPKCLTDNTRRNYMLEKKYLHQNELIEKCWNIKSLTIDLEDIKYIIKDNKLTNLYGLYARVNRLNLDNSTNAITILNNNSVNLSYIYRIINCEWMINKEENLNNIDLLKNVRQLFTLMELYDKEKDGEIKRSIKAEMDLIKYYMDTLINKYNKNTSNVKTLKLGKHFIK